MHVRAASSKQSCHEVIILHLFSDPFNSSNHVHQMIGWWGGGANNKLKRMGKKVVIA